MSLQFSMPTKDELKEDRIHDIIVIGSGPAGYAAALYAARAELNPLILTGHEIGGQVATTWEVDNYPAFPDGITGPELVERMQQHAVKFGAKMEMDSVTAVDFKQRPFTLVGYNGTYTARSIIIATGASPRKLGVAGEKELTGRGVSYCATCDGWFFKDKEVAVIGGGDSALEEALYLTKHASKVIIVHRRDELRAGPAMQQRARENEKIEFIWDSVVESIEGQDSLEYVKLKNVKTNELSDLSVDGVFILIGHLPNTSIFEGQIDIDDHGYIKHDGEMLTNVEGIWVAGEAGDPTFRQVITSAGMGAAAAIAAQRWLDAQT
ncbi:MAG: thioredoxin-disulfide reductase [Chloroflexota bacterium]